MLKCGFYRIYSAAFCLKSSLHGGGNDSEGFIVAVAVLGLIAGLGLLALTAEQ